MTQVFYRKYRPQKFRDVVGQKNTIAILQAAIEQNRIAHAYLFSGPRGTGKTTVARIFAREAGSAEEDIIEIDAASSRGIDEARALKEAVYILPLKSPYKIYIIDEVHMLTKEAFNALLKTLEEPPKHVIFILATTEPDKVLDTIVSRTQHFTFDKINIPDTVGELKKIAKDENISAADDALKLIAFFSEGSLRDAENIFFQIASLGKKEIKETDVRDILGAPAEEVVEKIIAFALKKDAGGALGMLSKTLDEGASPAVLTRLILRSVRAIYFLSIDPKTSAILEHEFSKDEIESFRQHASAGEAYLEIAMREMLNALNMSARNDYAASIPLELALVKIAMFGIK